MTSPRPALGLLLAACAAGAASAAMAQSGPPIAIGTVDAEEQCRLYQQYAGSRAVYADPWVYASRTSFFTYLVRDCEQNFPALRGAIEGALASSGKLALRRGGYVVSAHLSRVSGDGGGAPASPVPSGPNGFSFSSTSMFATVDFTVRDSRGRVVFGDVVTKRIETGSDVRTGDFHARSSDSGPGLYGTLQREVAQSIARKVAFHFVPMRVVRNMGDSVQLDYGAPLLALGQVVQATSPDGSRVVRYRVTSASPGSAIAELDGDGNADAILPGSVAIVIENDDPAANGRRFKRVPLP